MNDLKNMYATPYWKIRTNNFGSEQIMEYSYIPLMTKT